MAKRSFPRFQKLLDSYPDETAPCDQGWGNQCAIRMSIALVDTGFKLIDYKDPLCKHGHARGAKSLANYLWKQAGPPFVSDTAAKGKSRTKSKTGIISFKNIAGFRGGLGDHIDLWDKNATMTGEYFDDCKETWFWSIG
ncbi:MAG: hypothetical protein N838_04655 [Thiohalocapsa sp. PB-PSB1]|jgi:hypothetical protein|nr:MAG: hypothetical protein N838_04655 [Thiohalocapsa sp. PB-PSB1]